MSRKTKTKKEQHESRNIERQTERKKQRTIERSNERNKETMTYLERHKYRNNEI